MGNPKDVNEHHMNENILEENLEDKNILYQMKWHIYMLRRWEEMMCTPSLVFKDYYIFFNI